MSEQVDMPALGGDFGQQLAAAIVTAGSQRARTKKKRPERAARSANDKRPLISLAAGDIERIVDEVEAALIACDRGLYQRGGKIVGVERVPAIAAGDKK